MIETVNVADEYAAFRHDFDAREYAAAVEHAQRVLDETQRVATDPNAEDIQVAVMNLALAQYLAGDYTAAEASYVRAVDLIQKSGRALSARLARAYAGLASTYHAEERHELAVTSFEQAIAQSRRQEGLLNEEQVPLLEKYADSLTALGRYEDALQAYRYMLRIATRKYGDTDPRLSPTLERIGRWYASVGAYDQSRRALRRAVDIVEAGAGAKSPLLVGLLLAIADCNRRQLMDPGQRASTSPDEERADALHEQLGVAPVSAGVLVAEGEKALLRAVEIAEQRTEPSPVQVADVRTQLGDWYQLRQQPDRALPNYQQAWHAASRAKELIGGKSLAAALFGTPVLLFVVRPESWDKYAQRPKDQVEVRTVSVEFTVAADGKPRGPKVVDDSGDTKRAEKTLDAVSTARYRPRFEAGKPTDTPGVVLSQPWIVLLEPPGEAKSGSVQSQKKKPSS